MFDDRTIKILSAGNNKTTKQIVFDYAVMIFTFGVCFTVLLCMDLYVMSEAPDPPFFEPGFCLAFADPKDCPIGATPACAPCYPVACPCPCPYGVCPDGGVVGPCSVYSPVPPPEGYGVISKIGPIFCPVLLKSTGNLGNDQSGRTKMCPSAFPPTTPAITLPPGFQKLSAVDYCLEVCPANTCGRGTLTNGQKLSLEVLHYFEIVYSSIGFTFAILVGYQLLWLPKSNLRYSAWAIYICICWLLCSWYGHLALHERYSGIEQILFIDAGFHVPVATTSLFLVRFVYRLMLMSSTYKPSLPTFHHLRKYRQVDDGTGSMIDKSTADKNKSKVGSKLGSTNTDTAVERNILAQSIKDNNNNHTLGVPGSPPLPNGIPQSAGVVTALRHAAGGPTSQISRNSQSVQDEPFVVRLGAFCKSLIYYNWFWGWSVGATISIISFAVATHHGEVFYYQALDQATENQKAWFTVIDIILSVLMAGGFAFLIASIPVVWGLPKDKRVYAATLTISLWFLVAQWFWHSSMHMFHPAPWVPAYYMGIEWGIHFPSMICSAIVSRYTYVLLQMSIAVGTSQVNRKKMNVQSEASANPPNKRSNRVSPVDVNSSPQPSNRELSPQVGNYTLPAPQPSHQLSPSPSDVPSTNLISS